MRCIKVWNKIVRDIVKALPLGPFETRADKTAQKCGSENKVNRAVYQAPSTSNFYCSAI